MSGEYEKALASGYSQHLRRMGWGETELIAQTRRFIRAVKADAWDEAVRAQCATYDMRPDAGRNPYQDTP